MGQITGRFFITAIADGMTIHGSLAPNRSLVQRWNGAAATPDWTKTENQPTITLTVYRGSAIANVTSVKWYINDVEISSSDTGYTIVTPTSERKASLTIKKNLASSQNADIDVITCKGSVESNGSSIPFSVSIDVKLGYISGSGYTGIIEFLDNSDITVANNSVTLIPRLFKDTDEASGTFTVKWFLNDGTTAITTTDATQNAYITNGNRLVVKEAAVTDYMIVRCEFYVGGEKVATERVGIDDTVDGEYLWITYAGTEAKSASLSPGQQVTFKMWVATADNPNDTKYLDIYKVFRITAYNSAGNVISGYNNKTLTYSDGKASETFTYETVFNNGGDISVIVTASNQ